MICFSKCNVSIGAGVGFILSLDSFCLDDTAGPRLENTNAFCLYSCMVSCVYEMCLERRRSILTIENNGE